MKVIIGNYHKDPFLDSYEQEGLSCCDIIERCDSTTADYMTIVIDKRFLRKIVHSHILFIKELEKGLNCPQR